MSIVSVFAAVVLGSAVVAAAAPDPVATAQSILSGWQWQTEMPGPEQALPEEVDLRVPVGAGPAGAIATFFVYVVVAGVVLGVIVMIGVDVADKWRARGATGRRRGTTSRTVPRSRPSRSIWRGWKRWRAPAVSRRRSGCCWHASSPNWHPAAGAICPTPGTARDVLRRVAMKGRAAGALQDLVITVEISLFGGRAVTEADYHGSRAAYERLASAIGGPQ